MYSFETILNQSKKICRRRQTNLDALKKVVDVNILEASTNFIKSDKGRAIKKFNISTNQPDPISEYWGTKLKFGNVIMSKKDFDFKVEQFSNLMNNVELLDEVPGMEKPDVVIQMDDTDSDETCSLEAFQKTALYYNNRETLSLQSPPNDSVGLSCYARAVLSFNTKFLYKNGSPWCIDGLSATGKTSSISHIKKANKYLRLIAHNLHPSCAMGYSYSALKMMHTANPKDGKVNVWDRTPFHNIYPWFQIWMCLALEKRLENENKSEEFKADCEYLSSYLNSITDELAENMFSRTNTILIVDSNVEKANLRLRDRNEGSDYIRSFWKNYVHLQNLFYYNLAVKYPQHFILIDLNVFDGDLSKCQAVLREILNTAHENVPIFTSMFAPTKTTFKELNKPSILMKTMERDGEIAERIRPLLDAVFYRNVKELANVESNGDDCK